MCAPPTRHRAAFTLLEMMIVIVVAAVLVTMASWSLQHSLASQKLHAVAGRLAGDLSLAGQLAATQSRTVSVVFLEGRAVGADDDRIAGWQLQAVAPQTGVLVPLAEPVRLEPGIVFVEHADYSSVLFRPRTPGTRPEIAFKAEGGTTLPFDSGQCWCLTLALERDVRNQQEDLPPDSRTIVIHAHTGAATLY